MRQFCPHCHQAIMINKHPFSKSMAKLLLKVAEQKEIGEPFHLQNDINLTKSEYANFQKLRYFELAKKSYQGTKRLWGHWELTHLAELLIKKEIRIAAWVGTFNNEVVESSHDRIGIEDAWGEYDIPILWAKRAKPISQVEGTQMRLDL